MNGTFFVYIEVRIRCNKKSYNARKLRLSNTQNTHPYLLQHLWNEKKNLDKMKGAMTNSL